MENLERYHRLKKITKTDIVIYFCLSENPYLTIKQVSFRWGFDYSYTTECMKRLEDNNLVDKTKENPSRYFIK